MPIGYRLTMGYRLITVEHGIDNGRWGYKPITRWHHLALQAHAEYFVWSPPWRISLINIFLYIYIYIYIYILILTCKMTFYQAYILTYYLVSSLRFCFDHAWELSGIYCTLTCCLAFYLAFLSANLTYILTFYVKFYLTFHLAFYLTFFHILSIWHFFWLSV